MDYTFKYLCLLLCLQQVSAENQTKVVNVALHKPVINAYLTCGSDGPEPYYEHTQIIVEPVKRRKDNCTSPDDHPPSYMNDGFMATFWQSTSRAILARYGHVSPNPEVEINIDLEKLYPVKKILIQMGKSKRPGMIAIKKTLSSQQSAELPWVYRVTRERECRTFFGVPPSSVPTRLDGPICDVYTNPEGFPDYGSLITFDFTSINGDMITWTNARALKFQFYNMDITYGWAGIMFQHYSVSEISVMAECQCNGLQIDCIIGNATGQYECVCGGNTQGESCQECQPFYRQQPFQPGKPCEQCNCHNHADICEYNQTVANNSWSLNTQGERIGGGVCINCRDHTAGINCEKCENFYYRPAGVAQTSSAPCVQCRCSMAGVQANPQTGLVGDCVMNDDVAPPVPSMMPGDCFCKDFVQGINCDTCKPGYFNLTDTNPLGCEECACDPSGSISSAAVCSPNVTGQCPCKLYVTGRRCDECMDNYYGLNASNTDGCKPCNCDIGGAVDNLCDKTDGQCNCQRNVKGRQCLQPMEDFYYPGPHFIYGEFEKLDQAWGRELADYRYFGYAKATAGMPVMTNVTIPLGTLFDNEYIVLLRYRGNPIQTLATVRLTQPPYPIAKQILPDIGLTPCVGTEWCYYDSSKLPLTPGHYLITVTTQGDVSLDRVVIMPNNFLDNTAFLGDQDAQRFKLQCNILQTDQFDATTEVGQFCRSKIFSMTMHYLAGALPCNCHYLGSFSNETCDMAGGQCVCKPGVFTRTCSECQLEYYDLTSTGCKACDCAGEDKVCDRVTGQCKCPPLTTGRKCDQCEINNWNWTATEGCQPCNCNLTGSANLQCNLTTGVCDCKQGVTGEKCDHCLDGYMGFSATGCTSCQCDPAGTLSTGVIIGCDALTGQCPCKANSEGSRCERCKPGTFYNDESHPDGCLECVCMGVADECQSTIYYLKTHEVSVIDEADNMKSTLSLATEGGTVIADVNVTNLNKIPMANVAIGTNANTYWQHPTELQGNLLGLYESNISFTVYYTVTAETVEPSSPSLVIYGFNNSVYRFPVNPVPVANQTRVDVIISEHHISEVNVSRQELLLALVDVRKVLIPATWYPTEHQSYIGEITYRIADKLGTENRALAVEQCKCPHGYKGLSCEECDSGYHRDNTTGQGFLGFCIKCECNGHSETCDPDTGECLNCGDNTQGFSCNECKDGYHGDATRGTESDCIPCPCYEPRVLNSSCELDSAGLPRCLYCAEGYTGSLCNECEKFYFGNPHIQTFGTCKRCECNNNTDTCDPVSGVCTGCGYNTTGDQCERCKEGFFGDASVQNCSECLCDPEGSVSEICDSETGNCTCHPGLGTRTCAECLENYYYYKNLTFTGCIPCECNEFGSVSLQCPDTGICSCLDTVATGQDKCDLCKEGYWGLPDQACQECACDPIGTVDPGTGMLLCDRHSGQCQCKPGVAGRQCDKCDHLFVNFGLNGCQKCGRCQDALGNDTLALLDLADGYLNQTQKVVDVQTLDPKLQNLTDQVNETRASLGLSEDRLDVLTYTVKNLTNTEISHTNLLQQLSNKVESAQNLAQTLADSTLADLERLQVLENTSKEALDKAVSIQTQNPLVTERLQFYNRSAYDLLALGNSIYVSMNTTFDEELQQVQKELAQSRETLAQATNMQLKANQQSNLTDSLRNSASTSDAQLKILKVKVSTATEKLIAISFQVAQLYKDFNATVNNKEKALALLNDTQNILGNTEDRLVIAAQDFVKAQQWLKDSMNIYNGVVSPLPINTSTDLTGIKGWIPDSKRLEQELNKTEDQLSEYQESVSITESTAARLTQDAQNIQDLFQGVKNLGQDPVNAIDNYKKVVSSLNDSLQMALQANSTMSQTVSLLQAVSIDDLNAQAASALDQSQQMLQLVNSWNSTPALIEPRITAANKSLAHVINDWSLVNISLTNLQTNADVLQNKFNTSAISDTIQQANSLAGQILDTANNVILIDNNIRPLVGLEEKQVAQIQGMITNSTVLEKQMENDLKTFQDQLGNTVQRSIDLANVEYQKTNQTRYLLEEKLSQLEAKLLHAREKLAALEQPVSFDYESFNVMNNEDKGKALIFTEIVVQFAYRYVPKGVLFFAENSDTSEKIVLQLEDEAVMFEIKNVDSVMSVKSPAVLCPNCWFRVIATRYGIDGQLTVTKIETGGTAVSAMRLDSSDHELLTTTSDIYIGGLPRDYPDRINKTSSDPQFEGCIYNMKYNGDQIPIWQHTLSVESTSRCCPRPPALPKPPTINAADFKGFGYVQIDRGQFVIEQQGQITLQFRTFDPNAVLVLVDDQLTTAYYGLYLSDGHVQLDILSDGDTLTTNMHTTVKSVRKYNDGQWYKVSALHNSTYAQISVQKRVMMPEDTVDTRSSISIIRLSSLSKAQMTIGGQNPNTTLNRGPIGSSFAGAMVDFQLSQGANQIPMPWPLTRVAQLSYNVNLYEAYQDVVSGLGVSAPSGYVSLQAMPSTIYTLEFDLLTYEPTAVILFSQLRANPPQTYFYVGLFNGDVLVMFDQGLGTKVPVRTRGRYLATGVSHRIKVDFGAVNTPHLTVDGVTHTGQVTMSLGMPIEANTIYFGGIPSSVSLPLNEVPTDKPLSGGIRNVLINSESFDPFNEIKVNELYQNGAYLSGLPAPPTELPPLPYTTTPAPPTTPAPTCAPAVEFTLDENNPGLRFGDFPTSYMALSVPEWQLFEHAFLIKIQFRAVAGDGNLVYFANSATINPANYFAVYLQNGYIYASMKSYPETASDPSKTLHLKSTKDIYDDGNWWQVEILRIEDFMAIIINEVKDYANNGVPTMSTSTLRINTAMYAGGIPSRLNGVPFTPASGVPIGILPFRGCIRKIEVTTRTQELLKIYPSKPVETSNNLQSCYASISPGVYLKTANSYLRLSDGRTNSFDFANGFSVEINFTTSYRNGTLMSMWQSNPRKYFLLGFYAGKIKAIVSNSANPSKQFVAVAELGGTQYSVCDRELHSVKLIRQSTGLAIEADSRLQGFQFSSQDNAIPDQIFGQQLYLGILASTWNVPNELHGVSFRGCVKSVVINGASMKLFNSDLKNNIEEGCPSPPGEDQMVEFV